MQFDKSQIIDLLKSQGDDQKAQQADKELPQKVDSEKDSGLLEKIGVSPQDLMSKLGGGGGGGLGGLTGS